MLKAKEGWENTNKLREQRNGLELIDSTNLNSTNSARTQRWRDSDILTEESAQGW